MIPPDGPISRNEVSSARLSVVKVTKKTFLVLTAFLHRSAPFGEGVAFHLRIGLQRDLE